MLFLNAFFLSHQRGNRAGNGRHGRVSAPDGDYTICKSIASTLQDNVVKEDSCIDLCVESVNSFQYQNIHTRRYVLAHVSTHTLSRTRRGDVPQGMNIKDALKEVLRNALINDGLSRGLREAVKALDK